MWHTVGVRSLHILGLEHGNSQIKGVTTSAQDSLLAAAETRNGVRAAVGALLDNGGIGRGLGGGLSGGDGRGDGRQGEGDKADELHFEWKTGPGGGLRMRWKD